MIQQILALQNPDPRIKIRPVLPGDVDQLHQTCWAERPRNTISQLIHRAQQNAMQGRGLGVIVCDEGYILGYGQLTRWTRGAEISDLIVKPSHRSQGIGTAIIQYLTRAARDMHIDSVEIGVAFSNPRALALYRRLGFQDDHQVMINLGQGQEAVLYLRLDLPPARTDTVTNPDTDSDSIRSG